MRITRELLHKFAQQTVNARLRSEPDIHAAYMIGSIIRDNPLLGGTADIDLVLVHKYSVPADRECVSITPDVSLDIFHKVREDYTDHRAFRQDPWMGYPLTHYNIILYDSNHWLEFIQSSVNAEFHRPDNVLARVRKFSTKARDQWFSLFQQPSNTQEAWLDHYLITLSLAANSVSGLIGPPLTRRRFLQTFEERVEDLGVPKILAGLYGLLGFSDAQNEKLLTWIDAFKEDLTYLSEKSVPPAHLVPCRYSYYTSGIEALAKSDAPAQAIWPLLRTWLDVRLALDKPAPNTDTWNSLLSSLNLSEEHFEDKSEALDAYLDSVEIVIETWEDTYGI
jgi:hypothetical protein